MNSSLYTVNVHQLISEAVLFYISVSNPSDTHEVFHDISSNFLTLKFEVNPTVHSAFEINLNIQHKDTFQGKVDFIPGIVKVRWLTCDVMISKSV